MTAPRIRWTPAETTLALALYVQIPFGRIRSSSPAVAALAAALNRTPNSVAMKLVNFARLDPVHRARGVSGLGHGSRLDEAVWNRYVGEGRATGTLDLAPLFEDAQEIAGALDLSRSVCFVRSDLRTAVERLARLRDAEADTTCIRQVRTRIRQGLFRDIVLSAYGSCCAVTGLAEPQLLEAAHIRPWSEGVETRLDPENGISLCVLLHRAYDANLLGISPDLVCHVAPGLLGRTPAETPAGALLLGIDGRPLKAPRRFSPNLDLVSERYREFLHAAP